MPPLTPLPSLPADAPLADVRRNYRDDGVVILRQMFPASAILGAADALENFALSSKARPSNLRCRYQPGNVGEGPVLDAIDPILDVLPDIRPLSEAMPLRETLSALLGDAPRLFKDKAHFRRPGVKGYPVHQDYISWPGFPATFTTVLVALDRADEASGCLEVFAGQHRRGYLSPRDGEFHDLTSAMFPEASRRAVCLEPGDIAIFGAFLPHGSSPNRSATSRRQLYFSYNACFDGGDLRDTHYAQYFRWLEQRYRQFGDSSGSFA